MKTTLKKVLSMALVAVLTAGVTFGGTMAYLTDRDSEANVFTVGNVEIELNEKFEQGAELIPGVKIEKEPVITNTGNNDAWVWATVAIPAALDDADASKNVVHFNYYNNHVNEKEWTWKTDGAWNVTHETIDGVKYNVYTVLYQTALKSDEATSPVIHTVYMDTNVDIDPEGNVYVVENGEVASIEWNVNEYGNPVIYVSAYAIQNEGFETVQEAYAAYQTQWGDNGAEWGEPATVVTTAEELEEALKAGSYVVLGEDITIEKGIVIADGAVLDLNGFTLTDSSTGGRALGIQNGVSFSVVGDGEIKKDDTVDSTFAMPFFVSNGTLTVDGGTYNMGAPSEKDYSILLQNSSKVIINDGTFTNTANYPLFYAMKSSELEINGGYFESIGAVTPDLLDVEYHHSEISTITIKGGIFVNYNPLEDDEGEMLDDARVVVAEGYTVKVVPQDNKDVWYCVIPETN